MIQQVGSRLAGNGPFISLHDSVFCRRDDLTAVESAFREQFASMSCPLQLKAA